MELLDMKLCSTWFTVLATAVMFTALVGKRGEASVGADFARATLERAQALDASNPGATNVKQRDETFQSLRDETGKRLSQLTEEDRINFGEYMGIEISKGGIDGPEATERSTAAFVLISVGTSSEDMIGGGSRMLSSNEPNVRKMGEALLKDPGKLATGAMGRDISQYNRALHDPKVPRGRLIEVLFKIAPVESTQWFADHTGLTVGDRAALEPDLKRAWQFYQATQNPSDADYAEIESTLNRWMNSQSWILRSLANGLLQNPIEFRAPNLKMKTQTMEIPADLKIPIGSH